MSNMKRILEIIESDEDLKAVYEHAIKTYDLKSVEFDTLMQFLYDEALAELEI